MSAVLAFLGPILKSLLGSLLEMFAFTKKTKITETEDHAKGPTMPQSDAPLAGGPLTGSLFGDDHLV